METVVLKPIFINHTTCIAIYSRTGTTARHHIQKGGGRWSETGRCWVIPCRREDYDRLSRILNGIVILEIGELKRYLQENKNGNIFLPISPKAVRAAKSVSGNISKVLNKPTISDQTGRNMSPENFQELKKFQQRLLLKSYSTNTIRTYTSEFNQFLHTIQHVPAWSFSVDRIKDYLQYCHTRLVLSENTLHSRLNALKFYYEQVLKKEKFFWDIPRPKKPLLLPKLLNETELRKLFNALSNRKHKAMLFTTYSAGLRVSEIVNLKVADIDSKRMQIFISRAKGKKDRYVNLSPLLLDILRKYLLEYKPAPRLYLFESEQTFTCYPTRTVQQIFSTAKSKAGISKAVGVHSLRHSFATHLLDKGTDIKYIKDLLGHFNLKTTERYLHVSKQQLVNIASPFDDLWKRESIEW